MPSNTSFSLSSPYWALTGSWVVGLGDTIGIEEEAVSWLELELALPVFQGIEPGKEQSVL